MRLLYVAATRAKNALIVGIAKTSKGETSASNPWKLFEGYIEDDISSAVTLLKDISGKKAAFDAGAAYEKGAEKVLKKGTKVLKKSYEIKKPSDIKIKSVKAEEDEGYETERSTDGKDAALLGTMTHRIMEILVSSKNKAGRDSIIDEVVREYDGGDRRYAKLLGKVIDTVKGGGYDQNNGAPKDILSELLSAEEVHCELPFCCMENGKDIWHGVMDAVYLKGGKWHIVDYKTNHDPSDLDAKYKEQLDAYLEAFKEMTGNAADAVIYHLSL